MTNNCSQNVQNSFELRPTPKSKNVWRMANFRMTNAQIGTWKFPPPAKFKFVRWCWLRLRLCERAPFVNGFLPPGDPSSSPTIDLGDRFNSFLSSLLIQATARSPAGGGDGGDGRYSNPILLKSSSVRVISTTRTRRLINHPIYRILVQMPIKMKSVVVIAMLGSLEVALNYVCNPPKPVHFQKHYGSKFRVQSR